MKLRYLLACLILFAAASAHGQGIRFGDDRPVTSTQHVGSHNVYVPIASATINICAAPNVGVPCTNKATTYTDSTLNSTCPAGAQITLVGSSICVATTDSLGNWGAWVAAGNYTYTISSSAGTFGPYFFTAASGTGAGSTLIPMSPQSFSATPAFSAASSHGYTMTLTGNVTSSSITGSPTNGTILALNLCQDATGGRTFVYPASFTLPATLPFNATPNACNYVTVKFDGTFWTILNNSGSALAGGSSGDAQCNIPTNVLGACSDINDASGVVSIKGDERVKGPNPSVSVVLYGARAVNPNAVPAQAGITANCNGTATVTINTASTFQNGDGVRVDGCGITNTMATPSAPTVQAVLMSGPFGSEDVVNAPVGGTTYSYSIVEINKLGARTANSSQGTTTTGLATLGIITKSVSSSSLSGVTGTVNTSATTDLVPGAMVWMNANVSGGDSFKVVTTPNTSQFTYKQAQTSTLGSGAIIGNDFNYAVCNHITLPAHTGDGWQYAIYNTAGNIVGISRPVELFFDDCGATVMGSFATPREVPSATPVTATNNPLVTTIVSGAGTTTLVLAASASQTASGVTILLDDAPAIKAAYTAAGSGVPIYIPTDPSGNSFVVNSYLDLTTVNGTNIRQAGALVLNEPLALGTRSTWRGLEGGGASVSDAFGTNQYRKVTGTNRYPLVYISGQGGNEIEGIAFAGLKDQALLVLIDGSPCYNETINRSAFSTGASSGTVDYLGTGIMFRGCKVVHIDHSLLSSLMNNNLAMGPWAGMVVLKGDTGHANPPGQFKGTNLYTSAKTITVDHTVQTSDMQGEINGLYTQGCRMPIVTVSNGASLPLTWELSNIEVDTSSCAAFSNLTNSSNAALTIKNYSGASAGYRGPAVAGNPIGNYQAVGGGQGSPTWGNPISSAIACGFPNDGSLQCSFADRAVNVGGPGTFQHAITAVPATPSGAIIAGGSLSLGTHTYSYQWFDTNNNAGKVSLTTSVVATGGQQTARITVGTPPLGAAGFYLYESVRGRINLGTGGTGCGFLITGGLVVDDNGSVQCGQSAFEGGGLADAGIRNQNVFAPSFTIIDPNNTGFTSTTAVPAPLTANRTIKYPDATGFVPLLPTAATTETGSGAVVRAVSPALTGTPTVNGAPMAGTFTVVNVTPVTSNTNTTTDQNLMAITITASALNSASRTLLVQLAGVYSTPAGSTAVLTHKLKLCTVSGCGSGTVITLATWTTAALGAIQVTNDPYNVTLNASTQTAGASAAFESHGNLTIDLSALTTAAEVVYADNNTATVGTIDSTAQLFLQHSIAFSAASASNSATDRQMIADTVD